MHGTDRTVVEQKSKRKKLKQEIVFVLKINCILGILNCFCTENKLYIRYTLYITCI